MKPLPVGSREKVVLVFMRSPVLGTVKTRLARVLTPRVVLDLYKCFVADTLAAIREAGCGAVPCIHPPEALQAAAGWLGDAYKPAPQAGIDLGERMSNAFVRAFTSGLTRVLLVGTDIPDLPPAIYRRAFDALKVHPAVIGPAVDGGYYMVGFRNDGFLPDIFTDMPWGTDRVYAKTRKVFAAAGVKVCVLPRRQDIDTYDDLVSFTRNSGDGAAATRTCLHKIGSLRSLAAAASHSSRPK